jgi:hypothetical protein
MNDDTFIYRIGKLSLAHDDVVLIKTDMVLDKEQARQVHDNVAQVLVKAGYYNEVMVLSAGVELEVLTKET